MKLINYLMVGLLNILAFIIIFGVAGLAMSWNLNAGQIIIISMTNIAAGMLLMAGIIIPILQSGGQ